jgi:hypothetical protein
MSIKAMSLNLIRNQTIRLHANFNRAVFREQAVPVPRQRAIVLAAVQDQAFGGPQSGPVLTAAPRDGALIERPGRGNRSAGAELENVEESARRCRANVPVLIPHAQGGSGNVARLRCCPFPIA